MSFRLGPPVGGGIESEPNAGAVALSGIPLQPPRRSRSHFQNTAVASPSRKADEATTTTTRSMT